MSIENLIYQILSLNNNKKIDIYELNILLLLIEKEYFLKTNKRLTNFKYTLYKKENIEKIFKIINKNYMLQLEYKFLHNKTLITYIKLKNTYINKKRIKNKNLILKYLDKSFEYKYKEYSKYINKLNILELNSRIEMNKTDIIELINSII